MQSFVQEKINECKSRGKVACKFDFNKDLTAYTTGYENRTKCCGVPENHEETKKKVEETIKIIQELGYKIEINIGLDHDGDGWIHYEIESISALLN